MLGMKIFLLLSLSVLGYSMPQPEMKIIIHLHYDDFQPGPASGPEAGFGILPVGRRRFEGGSDYREDVEGSGLDDQPVEPQPEEAGDDYSDHWGPQPYQGSYDDGAERGGYGHHWS